MKALVYLSKLDPKTLITHHFSLDQIVEAYEIFSYADTSHALKVILTA